ncbi:MAG: hypothetical protein AAF515_16165 [Pseudomonadota bacterium]
MNNTAAVEDAQVALQALRADISREDWEQAGVHAAVLRSALQRLATRPAESPEQVLTDFLHAHHELIKQLNASKQVLGEELERTRRADVARKAYRGE